MAPREPLGPRAPDPLAASREPGRGDEDGAGPVECPPNVPAAVEYASGPLTGAQGTVKEP